MTRIILVLISITLLLCSCNEGAVDLPHEPGVYQGKVDKHTQDAATRSSILRKRLLQVQTDR